jgi:hypothetical protein
VNGSGYWDRHFRDKRVAVYNDYHKIYITNHAINPEAPTVADLAGATDISEYVITQDYYRDFPLAHYVGRRLGVWEYTPADELRDRLNAGLRGKTPTEPINWKGLR